MAGPADPEGAGRLPDLLVIGAMKCGTTTLFDRLGQHPGVWAPAVKEPAFFSTAAGRGLAWYRSLFAGCPPERITFEATVSYVDPLHAEAAAARIAEVLPSARLVVLLREPVARTRAHYLHEVQRGREKRPFPDALADPANPYVRRSRYCLGLRPYLDGPLGQSLLGLRTDDLDDDAAWLRLLAHAGLEPHPRPTTARNVGAEKAPMNRLGRLAYDRDGMRVAKAIPKPLRRLGRRVVFGSMASVAPLRASADAPVPDEVVALLREDAGRAAAALGLDIAGWW